MTNKKTGFIAIVGKPNVGKSTLLNALIGQKISIVSSKPQTTRNRVTGILNDESSQLVFMDTPGLLKPRNKLGDVMLKSINETLCDIDVCLVVVEPDEIISKAEEDLFRNFEKSGQKCILIINKIDTICKENLIAVIKTYSEKFNFDSIIPVSAARKDGVDIIIKELGKYVNDGPCYFPENMITDQSEKGMICEIVREKMLRFLDKEIPHGIAVEIESFEEEENRVDIGIIIYCEKASHKGIIIGKGGEMLKKISSRSRADIERLLGCKVYLKCWVKVKEDWRNNDYLIRGFGLE